MTDTKTTFPERMHGQAVKTHSRRAANALDSLIERATLLRKRIEAGAPAEANMAYDLAEQVSRIAIHLSALELLRETREWDNAERATAR